MAYTPHSLDSNCQTLCKVLKNKLMQPWPGISIQQRLLGRGNNQEPWLGLWAWSMNWIYRNSLVFWRRELSSANSSIGRHHGYEIIHNLVVLQLNFEAEKLWSSIAVICPSCHTALVFSVLLHLLWSSLVLAGLLHSARLWYGKTSLVFSLHPGKCSLLSLV